MTTGVEGLDELKEFSRRMREDLGDKLIRKPMTGGLRIMAKEMSRRAPRGKRKRRRRGRGSKAAPPAARRRKLYQAHGQKFKGGKRPVAKAGVNVGKKRAQRAPHGHLVGGGTKTRRNKRGANRGKVTPNDYVVQAVTATADQALDHVTEGIWQGMSQLAGATGGSA